ncbi:hypothetical protein [Streptomyces sp. NPDC046887]|uniref:hypothetical protein n=1 Tax=Streptomyces sp. NPDC046887 TaxID=3155472 RepID=UPI0033C2EBC5
MTTLHIEHAVTDYAEWKAVFDRFGDFRREGGVRGYRVLRPVDDRRYVVIDVDFDDAATAEGFLSLLRTRVWGSEEGNQAVASTPRTAVLDQVDAGGPGD